jgi:hypothetical protein
MDGFLGAIIDQIVDLGLPRNPSAEDPLCGKIEADQYTDWLVFSLFKGRIVYS